jgi:hypothetical protein
VVFTSYVFKIIKFLTNLCELSNNFKTSFSKLLVK